MPYKIDERDHWCEKHRQFCPDAHDGECRGEWCQYEDRIKVLISAPLRQDVKVFREYQAGLDRLIIPDGVTVDRHYIVNDCPEIIPEIRGSYEVMDTGDDYVITNDDHKWTAANLNKMPRLRNATIKAALDGGYDYLFSVDTDIVLQPPTLKRLLNAQKDMISEVFWTEQPNITWCNAWMYDQIDTGGMYPTWRRPGTYRVGMTGACTLIDTKMLKAGVNYDPIPNLRYLWGEDRYFCIRAAVHGFEIWLDTHYPATHLYTEKEYQKYISGGNGNDRSGTKGSNGQSPGHMGHGSDNDSV